MNRMRRWLAALPVLSVLCVCSCVLACGGAVLRDVWAHNRRLARYVAEFEEMRHPENTSRISLHKRVGLISGNGNHCDYFVGEMRRFQGEREEIEGFYAGREVAGEPVFVAFVENGEFSELDRWSMPGGLDDPRDWLDSLADSLEKVYVVYILDVGYEPGFDIRCH